MAVQRTGSKASLCWNAAESESGDMDCAATNQEPHPLLVDHIIEYIFDLLSTDSVAQLPSLRLVCSQWNHYAVKVLQRKYSLSFGGHKYNVGRVRAFLDELDVSANRNPASKAEVKDENNNQQVANNQHGTTTITFPITKFRLYSDLFQECNKGTVMDFMEKVGPRLESLTIFKDINSDIEYTEEELQKLNFPRLKHLVFSDRRRASHSLDATKQSFLYKIISSSCKTLSSLSIKFPREPIYEIHEKEDLVIKIFQEFGLPRLGKLKLDMSITDKVLTTLAEARLTVKALHLSLGASQFSSSALKNFLSSVRFSLEDLRLTDLYRRASLVVDFPPLERLQSFEIHGLELPAYFVTFPDFTYAGKMPSLRNLKLNTWAPIAAWEVFIPEARNEEQAALLSNSVGGVNDLALAMNFDCPILMKRIASIFSGVRILEMHFSRAVIPALRVVFKEMGQLEELKLSQSYLGEIITTSMDDVLTGLDLEECKALLRKRAYKTMDIRDLVERQPNLTDLKCLKRFDMFDLRHRNTLTDISAYLVFLKMERLLALNVGRSMLTETALKDLAARFPLGSFQKYLSKRSKYGYDLGLGKGSVYSFICAVQ